MGHNFKLIGNIDCANAINKINSLPLNAWQEFTFRQDNYDPHKDTFTVPLLFNENFSDLPIERKYGKLFREEMLALEKLFNLYYHKGRIVRALLVNLPAQKNVSKHLDFGISLERCNRHHIALITNKDVIFTVDTESKFMGVGEVWEINNNTSHSVFNNGQTDRIHLIVDWDTSL